MNSPYPVLLTSLAEIYSFKPCKEGWNDILRGQNKTEPDSVLFPIIDAVRSNSISDICWLLGQRGTELQIAVKFTKLCADSVSHLNNSYSRKTVYAADAATYAAAADADADADYAADAAHAAHAATYAATYSAQAAAHAAAADKTDAYAADVAYAHARSIQRKKNEQFMTLCLSHFNPVTFQVELPS